jgi:HD-like signal output (HDOD) protein
MLTTLTKEKSETDKLVASAIADLGEIATLPEVTVRIIQIVENPKSTARDLHEVIRNDPALSSRLLKVVNSAFYGLPGQIANIDRAIVLLGLSAVKNIAIAASMTHLFNAGGAVEGFSGLEVWRHSIAVGVATRLLSASQGRPTVEEGFLAGLIHDLGLLIERQVFGRKLAEVIRRNADERGNFCDLERDIIGADHQAFGMALGQKWRFPMNLCMAIGYHHKPMDLAPVNRELATLVHVADTVACRCGIGFTATAAHDDYDDYMLSLLHIDAATVEGVVAKLPEEVAATESIFRE